MDRSASVGPAPRASAPSPEPLLDRSNLSTSQFLIWLGQRLAPATPLYNMVLTFDIGGPLDPHRFGRAFASLASNSDALRTVFDEVDGVPWQRVGAAVPAVEHLDLSGARDPLATLRSLVLERAARPFDLRDRLIDTALIRLAPDRHVWYLNQHHLITDAWATALVYRHVASLYARACDGTVADAPRLPQYAAAVASERSFRRTPLFERVCAHWRPLVESPAEPVRLYGRRTGNADTRTERVTLDLGIERSTRLRTLADRMGAGALTGNAARFDVLATALFAYLHRVSGQTRLAIGTPSHNRPSATLKETIGPLIELFPIAIEVAGAESFRTLLERVRGGTRSFLRYAQPGASSAGLMRGFNVVLNYIHATFPDFAGLPMRSEWVHPGHGDPRHHLRLQVHDFDASGSLVLHFDFRSDLLDSSARRAAAAHFLRMLDAFLADPSTAIGSVDLLTDEGRAVVPASARAPGQTADVATVVDLLTAQAARTPDAIAVSCAGQDLTYAALFERAERLAGHLRHGGLEAESRVGIYLERSPEAVVAILGVLLAGGAYVPLSPGDPPGRSDTLLQDAGVRFLITDATLEHALPAHDAQIVRMDGATEPAAGTRGTARPRPDDAAYVLYTSGSTGRPKGVVVEHGALAQYVTWASECYLRGRALDFPLFTSLSFDLTVTSLFLPLVSGGRIVVYPDTGGGAGTLLRVLDEDRVDAIKLTPSHLSILAGEDLRGSRVGLLILGGEDLRTGQARDAQRTFGDVEIHNEYGPTEATVGCMTHRYDPVTDNAASVPIGRAAGGARIYLLDAALNPVPPGVTGEIFIAGSGVARGYLNRPDETARHFVADPFAGTGRMYRTGDLARARPDGLLEFLGRADAQLEIRGSRIEPAEIEAALVEHPGVRACVVDVVRPDATATAEIHCTQCGLPSTYPGIALDDEGVCQLCRGFPAYRDRVQRYFRSLDDLRERFHALRATRSGDYDCVMLLSGGKDSTYALCRLVDMGLSVLAFTLDNGYISEGAKANIRRVTGHLGVDHVFGSTPAMNAIFVDSLKRHANVCNGCFKTIYTLGVRLARDRGIPVVVTGLSRGQFFETRLTEELFRDDALDADRIDRVVLEARKAYHRADDAIARLLDTREFQTDEIFDEVQFIDFYRYCDVPLHEMLRYLARHVPWIRPEDTGRSTNCLINEVGIAVHRSRRGFHNYAFPYSWDVRVGHKTRAATIHELTDAPDARNVRRILGEIGYDEPIDADAGMDRLVAYYESDDALPAETLRAHLRHALPGWMVPSHFVRIERLPLGASGKVDRSALRRAARGLAESGEVGVPYVAPRGPVEERIAAIWVGILGVERVGARDGFLELGGNSLSAIRIIARVNEAFGIELPLQSAFEASTVSALATLVETVLVRAIGALSDEEVERLAAGSAPSPQLPSRG